MSLRPPILRPVIEEERWTITEEGERLSETERLHYNETEGLIEQGNLEEADRRLREWEAQHVIGEEWPQVQRPPVARDGPITGQQLNTWFVRDCRPLQPTQTPEPISCNIATTPVCASSNFYFVGATSQTVSGTATAHINFPVWEAEEHENGYVRFAVERAATTDGTNVHFNCYYLDYGNWAEQQFQGYTSTTTWNAIEMNAPPGHPIYSDPPSPEERRRIAWMEREMNEKMERLRIEESEIVKQPEFQAIKMIEHHEIEYAYQKSKELLRTWLTEDEYNSLIKCEMMLVSSKIVPDREYVIYDEPTESIEVYDVSIQNLLAAEQTNSRRLLTNTLCIQATDGKYPKYDRLLAKILLLKADEEEFVKVANWTRA